MNKEKRENFIGYLDQRTSVIDGKISQLIRDNRRDDANFEKIRVNIYQIFKTVFQTSLRISTEEEKQLEFFKARLKDFEKTWKTALDKATEHNDTTRILQEQLKLQVLNEVRNTFEGIWEVTV